MTQTDPIYPPEYDPALPVYNEETEYDPALPVYNEETEYDAAQVADAIASVENTFEAMIRGAVQTPNGDTVSIAIVSPNRVPGKFYGPQTKLVLEAARLWHDHLRSEDFRDDAHEEDATPVGVVPTITAPAATKTVYRVLVSIEGETQDCDYFIPYDRRKDAFIFAATLDPEAYDEVYVVEDEEVPADTLSCEPLLHNDGVEA
jgi:hypothetical protein